MYVLSPHNNCRALPAILYADVTFSIERNWKVSFHIQTKSFSSTSQCNIFAVILSTVRCINSICESVESYCSRTGLSKPDM